jgi:hypothetical protein
MPNIIAYLALFSWPIVAIILFRILPLQKALVWTIIGGYLLLPSATSIKFPMVPLIDKSLVTSLPALILCLVMAPPQPPTQAPMAVTGRHVLLALFVIVVLSPVLTVLQNTEPVIDGRVFLPGLRLNDAIGLISQLLVSLIPLWLGLRYLNSREGLRTILEVLAIGGLAYTIPALFEVRFSPQLHTWVYGFFPHNFAQHVREGGFRPVVFLTHGLFVGIYLCIAAIAAMTLYREARREGRATPFWLVGAIWLLVVLFLSKNFGAMMIAVVLTAAVFLLGRRSLLLIGLAVAAVVMVYPILRGAGWIPVDTVHEFIQSINADRAASLKFRLDTEDALLARASEKPLFGWGSWGRDLLHDPATGNLVSIVDGIWVGVIGSFGWIGYIGRFGLLTAPILFFALRRRAVGDSFLPFGLIITLSATLIDLLPNSALVNYVWLMAGAVAGHALWWQVPDAEGSAADELAGQAGTQPFGAPPRAAWLMPDTGPTATRGPRGHGTRSRR